MVVSMRSDLGSKRCRFDLFFNIMGLGITHYNQKETQTMAQFNTIFQSTLRCPKTELELTSCQYPPFWHQLNLLRSSCHNYPKILPGI